MSLHKLRRCENHIKYFFAVANDVGILSALTNLCRSFCPIWQINVVFFVRFDKLMSGVLSVMRNWCRGFCPFWKKNDVGGFVCSDKLMSGFLSVLTNWWGFCQLWQIYDGVFCTFWQINVGFCPFWKFDVGGFVRSGKFMTGCFVHSDK